jgi:regulation of enolase protein 1 (concanavalin A-like superfamily)
MPSTSVLPFPLTPEPPHDWAWSGGAAVETMALPQSDFFVDPVDVGAALPSPAATLLGPPPAGDFQLSARVAVDFRAQYDAGVLLVWKDDRHWAKLCFERSPAGDPMVVSVVTRGTSDDANAFVVEGAEVRLRVSRLGRAYAFHACTDGSTWHMIRLFSLGDDVAEHRIGFEAQSPMGDGCRVRFDDVAFVQQRLADVRDGS